jgi:undecaprenyl-diphosphatase
MRPLPLLAAAALLAFLALRRRTLGRITAAAGLLVVIVVAGYGLGLYTLPSIDDALTRLAPALGNWTYPLVGVLAYLEAAAFVGLLVPGELTVVLGGAVARDGEVSIGLLFVVVWFAAVAGDTTGFVLGRNLGRGFLFQHGPRFHITPEIVARVEGIFDRHGGKAIILGRFIGVARAVTPFLAGSSHLAYRRFLRAPVLTWGATAGEASRPMPGDDLLPEADVVATPRTRSASASAPLRPSASSSSSSGRSSGQRRQARGCAMPCAGRAAR